MNYTMQTYAGRSLDPMKLTADDIDILDIAHPLSLICRYGGHCKEFYSVAQHCVLLSYFVPKHLASVALMHDASESYVGDMIQPLKYQFPEFKEKIENQALDAVFTRFGLHLDRLHDLEDYDRAISINEMEEIMCRVDPFLYTKYTRIENLIVSPWPSSHAESRFLERFYELFPHERVAA